MMKYRSATMAFGITIFLGACHSTDCSKDIMINAVHKDIINDNRDPKDFQVAEIKRQVDKVYVGMTQNISPFYRRHYILDSRTCAILDVKIDQ